VALPISPSEERKEHATFLFSKIALISYSFFLIDSPNPFFCDLSSFFYARCSETHPSKPHSSSFPLDLQIPNAPFPRSYGAFFEHELLFLPTLFRLKFDGVQYKEETPSVIQGFLLSTVPDAPPVRIPFNLLS